MKKSFITRLWWLLLIFIIPIKLSSSSHSAEFINFGTLIVSGNTQGYVKLSPNNNRLSCVSTRGDIACNPIGQRAIVQMYGTRGTRVQIYCPKQANINVQYYGRMSLYDIAISNPLSSRDTYCIKGNKPTLQVTLQGNTNSDALYIGGTLKIRNITPQNSTSSSFNVTIIYQ